jgi:beta-N-acetylhexosaminidase
MTLRNDVGQLLIVGLGGAELEGIERAWLKLIAPAGVILFRRNVQSAAQTHALLSDVRTLAAEPLFRCVDVEGGLVDRLRDAVAPMPDAATVARAAQQSSQPKLSTAHGRLIGRELRMLGFNVTFAPVLDLHTAASAEVMRTRVAAPTSEGVISYAKAFLEGLARERVLGCGKHFPGLGSGNLDSHLATPRIERTWDQLWSEDMLPYRKLHPKLAFIMVSHATYPNAMPPTGHNKRRPDEAPPASLSPFWIKRVLQRKIAYRGLVISDDMEMGGVLQHSSIEEAAIAAVAAGTHLIEVCKDPALVLRAFEALLREAEGSRAFRRIVQGSAAEVRTSKHQLLGRDVLSKAPSDQDVRGMRERVEHFSAEIQQVIGADGQRGAAVAGDTL